MLSSRSAPSYRYSFGEPTDGEGLIAHHQTDLTPGGLAAELPAKGTKRGEVAAILDVEDRRQTVLFVTSELDEAILLADKLLIMSNQPGHIKKTMTIALARQGSRAS
jgi:hypothetical protein